MGFVADLFGANKAAKAQEKAARQAADASREATDKTLALQREQFDRIWGATETGRQAGDAATKRLAALSGLSVDGQPGMSGSQVSDWLRSTPGYDFNFREGQRSLETSLARRGLTTSGAAVRSALRYGQDYGDRIFNQERSALGAIAGIGQTATSQGGSAGQNMANVSSQAVQTNADRLGSSYRDIADAKAGFWGTVSGSLGNVGKTADLAKTALRFVGF
jgi:hypothetical protein